MIDEKKLLKELRAVLIAIGNVAEAIEDLPARERLEAALTSEVNTIKGVIALIAIQSSINGWISTSDHLPPDPKVGRLDDIEELENAIERKKISEYLVTIEGATEATTLWYAGNGRWYDYITGESYYPVTAWQQLPEAYQPQ